MKAKKTKRSPQEQLEDLALEGAPDGVLDDELEDAAMADMRMELEDIQGRVLLDQLDYLYMRGYDVGRLRQLIKEAKRDQ